MNRESESVNVLLHPNSYFSEERKNYLFHLNPKVMSKLNFVKFVSVFIFSLLLLFFTSSIKAQSPFGIGYQWQTFKPTVYPFEGNDVYATYNLDNIRGFFLDEPGIIMGALSAVYGTEANKIQARNKAIREGELMYRYELAKPMEMASWRWWRWSYVRGSSLGVQYHSKETITSYEVTPEGGFEPFTRDTVFIFNDSLGEVSYYRVDFNIVTSPRLIGNSGLYWMPSAALNFSETKLNPSYVAQFVELGWHESKFRPGPLSTNLLLHVGYQPSIFPWLMVEGNGGVDFIQWGLAALLHTENFKPSYRYGVKIMLGTDWLQLFYNYDYITEAAYGKTTRTTIANAPTEGWSRIHGHMGTTGFRVDLGALLYKLF